MKSILCFVACVCPYLSLVTAQQPELVLPIGHTSIVRTARFSPDNKFVVTGGADKVVNIWETFSGKKIRSITGLKTDVSYAFFSNDGHYLVAGSDSSAVLWSIPSYQVLAEFNKVRRVMFSPDSRKFFLSGYEGTTRQYSLPSMEKEFEYPDSVFFKFDFFGAFNNTSLSQDGRYICFAFHSTLSLWDTKNSIALAEIKLNGNAIKCFFTSDNQYLAAVTASGIQLVDLENKFAVKNLSDEPVINSYLSRNNKFLLTTRDGYPESGCTFWDMEKYQPIFLSDTIHSGNDTFMVTKDDDRVEFVVREGTAPFDFPSRFISRTSGSGVEIADNGKFIRMGNTLWDTYNNHRSYTIEENSIRISDISKDGQYMLVQQKEGIIGLWAIDTKKTILNYETKAEIINLTDISPDGKKLLVGSGGASVSILEVQTGRILYKLTHRDKIVSATFSPDGSNVLTNSLDSTASLWNAETGELTRIFPGHHPEYSPAYYTDSGELVLSKLISDSVPVYDINDPLKIVEYVQIPSIYPKEYIHFLQHQKSYTGRYQLEYQSNFLRLTDNQNKSDTGFDLEFYYYRAVHAFSKNDKYLAIAPNAYGDTVFVWDLEERKWIFKAGLGIVAKNLLLSKNVTQLFFSDDNRYLLAADENAVIHVLSVPSFEKLFTLAGENCRISGDGNLLVAVNQGNCTVYDFNQARPLYSYFFIDSVNYLITDNQKRFDGTEAARKILYLSCGTEIIELEQAKDLLWVPGLAERIMKKDSINAKTLRDLNICGLTPEIENKNEGSSYYFQIKPRRGGLGETVLFVNGIEAVRYKPAQLTKNGNNYELRVKKEELNNYFIAGQENTVTVKAYTSDNAISSRGIKINEDKTKQPTTPPNLYAVMVGVSDYKGEDLDLKYAAKDATDISNAVAVSARKLLNTDGNEHVFMYNLTTANERYQLPEKNSIKKTLEEIGKKATANDILLIFFAGHGVMEGEKKQFYFLTADASKTSAADAVADVGISTAELTEWMKPQNIKAQKRILIFDACNSGQAIKDFVKMGTGDQNYMAARDDDKAQQIKAIDKLNEKSGLFILSASASSQSAYEMGRYSQGLLTYSLLKAIKLQPDILEDGRYLNVSRWFNAAEKTVSDLAKESGARQEPQIVTNTNFNIGIVDEEVTARIILPQEMPLFTASNFQNSDEAADGDNLELSKTINLQLADISARGTESKIVYIMATNSPEAYTLSGRYDIKNNEVTVRVNVRKNNETRHRFEEKGTKDRLKEMAAAIVARAAEWATSSQ